MKRIETDVIFSADVGDLENRVFELASSGASAIIVAGGDGSVHEAVNGIMRAGADTRLGLVPVGTGNDFAKACSIPLDWRAAAEQLADRIGKDHVANRIDLGRMNERWFANGAGIGFDAKINRIARKYRWPIGDLVYLFAVFEGLWDGVITPQVTMRFADEVHDGAITLANVSNGPWVGGMFHIAPGAKNDDGVFDLVYATPVTRLRVLALLPRLIRGTHIGQADIHRKRVDAFHLAATSPVPSHLDGEVQALQRQFDIALKPGALALL